MDLLRRVQHQRSLLLLLHTGHMTPPGRGAEGEQQWRSREQRWWSRERLVQRIP